LADHDKIRSMLTEAGFADVTTEDMGVEWNYGSFDEAWEFWTQVAGPVASVVKQLGADDIERLRDALQEAVQPFQTGSSIKLPGVTINATAS
ncbi:MAG: hypothetical protein QOF16_955, partial [Actinomycetota bacterium]|nr:hypothetical protein [Actinomycetota bacterium]